MSPNWYAYDKPGNICILHFNCFLSKLAYLRLKDLSYYISNVSLIDFFKTIGRWSGLILSRLINELCVKNSEKYFLLQICTVVCKNLRPDAEFWYFNPKHNYHRVLWYFMCQLRQTRFPAINNSPVSALVSCFEDITVDCTV